MAVMSLVLETLNSMPLDCKFPSDMTAREVADDIAIQLNYPFVDEDTNEPINYFLTDGDGKRIEDDAKLEDAGLRNGDTVKLEANKAITPPPMPATPTSLPDGQVGVWVKLLNQTRNVYEQFDAETTVSDLLAQMIAKYDLPARYPNSKEPIVYVVASKTQGRQLHSLETLREAFISHLDTIFINTDNKAGGGPPLTNRVLLRPVGLRLDEVTEIGIPALMENEPALKMALHAFKDTLYELEESRRELQDAHEKIEQLTEQRKGNHIATALLLFGQIQIGFATNLITNDTRGGWFVFFSGLALNLGALYFLVFSGRKEPRV